MRLRPVHFLLLVVPLVSGGGAALDKELETALFYRLDAKRCTVCGALFRPGSNRAKYCPECAGHMKRIKAAQRKRKQRAKCHALGPEKPL